MQYLSGQLDDITDIDSLRKVREIFNQIRNQYRKLKQSVEAMNRQIEMDPTQFAKNVKDAKKQEEIKVQNEEQTLGEGQEEVKQKRKGVDKQQAFGEFKLGEGRNMERAIVDYRNDMKDKRSEIKTYT